MAPTAPQHDYYAILEVNQSASPAAIKASYHRLALKRHPDKNPHDPAATEKFQLVTLPAIPTERANFSKLSQAWETIKDADKRREYDSIYPSIAKGTHISSRRTATNHANRRTHNMTARERDERRRREWRAEYEAAQDYDRMFEETQRKLREIVARYSPDALKRAARERAIMREREAEYRRQVLEEMQQRQRQARERETREREARQLAAWRRGDVCHKM